MARDGAGRRERRGHADHHHLGQADGRDHGHVAAVARDHDRNGERERHRQRTPSPITSASPGVPEHDGDPGHRDHHRRPCPAVELRLTQHHPAQQRGQHRRDRLGYGACATVVWLRATMKLPEAIAVEAATPTPAMPIERNAPTTLPRSVSHTQPEQRHHRESGTARQLRRRADVELTLEQACRRPGDGRQGNGQLAAPT